jgi:hypothetical protein
VQKNKPDPTFDKVRFILVASEKKIYSFLITTDRVKLFNRPERLDFFNPPPGGYLVFLCFGGYKIRFPESNKSKRLLQLLPPIFFIVDFYQTSGY